MREILVVAKCDRCKAPLDTNDDEPAQAWTIMGFEYRIDLCDTCQEKVAEFLSFLPKPENFRCPDCDRVFDTQQGLSMHRTRSHTKDFGHKASEVRRKDPVPVDGGIVCAECGEGFANKYALSGHMGKHRRAQT